MPEFVNPFPGIVPGKKMTHRELLRGLRLSLSAEEEATHLYEALADATDNELARAVLQDIADEEKVHKGEFQRLIEILSPGETAFLAEGAGEVNEIHGRIIGSETASETVTVGDLKTAIKK